MVKIENAAGCSVSQSASAAAIFIGCCSVMILPWMSPVIATSRPDDQRASRAPALAALRNGGRRRRRAASRRQIETPATKAPLVMNAAAIVCGNVMSAVVLVSTARKSVSSARPARRVERVADRVLHPASWRPG